MKPTLRFGRNQVGLPEGLDTAWGARWIVGQAGSVDQLHDRQDCVGPPERRRELLAYLNDVVQGAEKERARQLLASGELRTGFGGAAAEWRENIVLYEDEACIVVANPQGSHGYLYVAAWLKAHVAVEQADNRPIANAIEQLAERHGRVRVQDLDDGGCRVVYFDRGLEDGAYIVARDGTTRLERP